MFDTRAGGPAAAYVYDPFSREWIGSYDLDREVRLSEELAKGGRSPSLHTDPVSVVPDPKTRELVMTMMDRNSLQVAELSGDRMLTIVADIPLSDFDKLSELYDADNEAPPAITILRATEDWLILGAEKGTRVDSNRPKEATVPDRVYLFDRKAISVFLTFAT